MPNPLPKKQLALLGSEPQAKQEQQKSLETRFMKILKTGEGVVPQIEQEILEDGLDFKASDIHFEPREKEVNIRFRIDGVLHEVGHISKLVYENVLNRIKVQSHLRVDEHFAAQDGAMRYLRKDGTPVDLRVSIIPINDGEKIAIRLLAEYVKDLSLADLGLSPEHQKLVVQASRKPFGMVLATGPTGSGKTTTLYALLKTFNSSEINITTIEDPVEYRIEGANQIRVNPQTNLTFAKGLRSIIRQDPDVILVGEIRDRETAEIAVNAALTGHLLFSTFHSNDAATGIPRLLDMGIEAFLLASTLEVVLAQRLARKICEKCRYPQTTNQAELAKYIPNIQHYIPNHGQEIIIYKGKGCPVCNFKGYKGRIGIFEMIHMTPELKEVILKNPSSREIWDVAATQGAKSLFVDGLSKVLAGVTSLDELFRVAPPPEI